jgi:hypothetical protein
VNGIAKPSILRSILEDPNQWNVENVKEEEENIKDVMLAIFGGE